MEQFQQSFRLGLIQLAVGANKAANVKRAVDKVQEAVRNGANVVSLPECFNAPYGTKYFAEYAEEIPNGDTCQALKQVAKDQKVYLIGGSIPEREGDKLYNTMTVWSPEGELLETYRKMHLFDIDIPGKITFKGSIQFISIFLDLPRAELSSNSTTFSKDTYLRLSDIYSQKATIALIRPPVEATREWYITWLID